jgi:hypothetical protein
MSSFHRQSRQHVFSTFFGIPMSATPQHLMHTELTAARRDRRRVSPKLAAKQKQRSTSVAGFKSAASYPCVVPGSGEPRQLLTPSRRLIQRDADSFVSQTAAGLR